MAARDAQLLNDRALADQARGGDAVAVEELFRRHGERAWRLGIAVAGDVAVAHEATVVGFARAFALMPGAAALATPRAQLLGHVRHAALSTSAAEQRSALPVLAAFQALPERSRSVVWLTAVDGVAADEVATALEVDRDALPAFLERALTGLTEGTLRARLAAVTAPDCQRATARLADYAGGRMSSREANRVRRHLDQCASCRALLVELDDVVPVLSAAVPTVPASLEPDVIAAWRGMLGRPRGPIHLVLPGGRSVPAWAERAVAGAAAAVVALGILSASLVAGRGGRAGEDRLVREVASGTPGAADGEGALGSNEDRPVTDDRSSGLDGYLPPARVGSSAGSNGSSTPAPSSDPAGQPTPNATDPGSGTGGSGSGTGGAPAAPAPPAATEPLAEIRVTVPDTLSVQVGDECTGVDLLGTVIGCSDPSEGSDTIEVTTGGSLLPPLHLGL